MLQSKDIEWENGLKKKKTHIYAAYKRLISDLKAHADWKWEDGETFFMQIDVKRYKKYLYQKK